MKGRRSFKMKWTSLNDLREQYLSFYESKGHLKHKSFPLVPNNDKSLLLINAGMAPLKKYFTGEEEPPRHRMTTCQKCIRTPDIERVGLTARHGTFFEMLGNFSFGDYFKREAIKWAWEFVTEVIRLPEDKVWVTIYENDDEAFEIWNKEVGVPAARIVRLGKEDNFWEIGSGPCGPCSEIYFDRGEAFGCGSPDCKPGCDCDRFMEFWNLVFTQFDGDGNGNYTPLAKPNIDTGMGLERLACIMQGVNNLFEVDTVRNIMYSVCKKANVNYGDNEKSDVSLRVITDHMRGSTFLIADGVVPSNEGRGYVLRRLIRRAARHGRLLGIKDTFLEDVVTVVAKENETAYPELTEKLDYIKKIIGTEEARFAQTIDSGLDKLSDMIEATKAAGSDTLSGEDCFKLSDTFGFPLDLTKDIAAEHGMKIDTDAFAALMAEQKQRARDARSKMGDFGWSDESFDFLANTEKTVFTGYDEYTSEATVVAIIDADSKQSINEISEGDVFVITDRTPFYGEGGGQVGDTGVITKEGGVLKVNDTKKHDGIYIHSCTVDSGVFAVGDKVIASVDAERRNAIKRNHSSVHLLQAALRRVLGNHVEQSGSYVDVQRARFDFTHYAAMTAEEIAATEAAVNKAILDGMDIVTVETDIESAKAAGAMALFGEKYGSTVRMVKMGDFSTELCGGTHLDNTAKAGLFKIVSETSVAAGVRRIEALTGYGVLSLLDEKDALIKETARELKVNKVADIAHRAAALQNEIKAAKHDIEALEAKISSYKTASVAEGALDVKGVKVIAKFMQDTTVDGARAVCDTIKSKDPLSVTVICVNNGGKINFVCCCGAEAVAKGAHAGNILKQVSAIAEGNGGGRPDMATSGAKNADKIGEALGAVADITASFIK